MNGSVAASRASPLLTLLPLLGCAANCANAAEAAGGAAALSLPEVQITATRVAEAIEYVPASLTVIRGEDLRRLGSADLRTALATGAGVDAPPGGDTGPAGPFPGALPSGATLRGEYALYGEAAGAGALTRSAISFGFTLASIPTAHFVALGETGGTVCPGTNADPQAAPGQLCIYEDVAISVSTVTIPRIRRYGALLTADSTAGGLWGSTGSWAVTAP